MALLSVILAASLAMSPPPAYDEGPAPAMRSAGIVGSLATTTITTPRFRLVATPRALGMAVQLSKDIEGQREAIVKALGGRDWPGVTEVRVGFGREEYEALALPDGKPPSWAVALAYPHANIVLVEANSLLRTEGKDTLQHELVHVALGQLGHGWPHWFQEGLAQDITQERRYSTGQFTTMARAVASDRVFQLSELSRGFPAAADDVEIAYALSAGFVEFVRARHGSGCWGAVIDEVGAGRPFEQAFSAACHTSMGLEERLFRETLPSRYPWWVLVTSASALWGALALLMVVAWARRRSAVRKHRAELMALELVEDAALELAMNPAPAANEDGQLETLALSLANPVQPWRVWLEHGDQDHKRRKA